MTQANADVLRGFMDEVVNQKKLDMIPKYISESYIGHGAPYVGMGVRIDDSSGDKVTILQVHPGSPAEGKLMPGDELVRIIDGERTVTTFDELRQNTWGQGPLGTPVTLQVRRQGAEHDVTLTRGLVQGFEFTYDLFETGNREFFKEWPDLKTNLEQVIECGEVLAYHTKNQGYNVRYDRSAVWAEFGIVRIQEGKITDWWSVEDVFSQIKQLGYTILPPVPVNV